jgi:hypothetical protein
LTWLFQTSASTRLNASPGVRGVPAFLVEDEPATVLPPFEVGVASSAAFCVFIDQTKEEKNKPECQNSYAKLQ